MTGQQNTRKILARMVQEGRMPHSLLLLGHTGSGSLAVALWLARYLQCENRPADRPEPCGVCNACRKAGQHIHPDIHYSYPTVGANAVSTDFIKPWREAILQNPYFDINTWLQRIGAENKQGNINKEECNAIIKKLSLRAFEGQFKILLMWRPEFLGKEGNRLLKLIEEPPEQTQFIFVAENTDEILPTVLSRCQLVKIGGIPDEELTDMIRAARPVSEERARQTAFLADGNFWQALQFCDNEASDDSAMLVDWLRKCWRGYGPDLMQWTDGFAKLGRENQKQFIQYSLQFLRELFLHTAAGRTDLRLPVSEQATAQNMSKVLGSEQINAIIHLLNDNYYFIERNANSRILFLDTSIKVHDIMKKTTLV